jgi:hypothetical protein
MDYLQQEPNGERPMHNATNTMNRREGLCKACGETFDGGSIIGECLPCYVDSACHGGCYESIEQVTEAVREFAALPENGCYELTKADERMIRDVAHGYGMQFAGLWEVSPSINH